MSQFHQLLQNGRIILDAPPVEGDLESLPGLGVARLLHAGEVVRVLEADLAFALGVPLEALDEVVGQTGEFVLAEVQNRVLLVQVLAELDAQIAHPLLDILNLILRLRRQMKT